MDVEAIIRLNTLLAQADTIKHLLKQVMADLSNTACCHTFQTTYMHWYEACCALLPDDLFSDFEKAYAVSRGGMPHIQHIMALLTREDNAPSPSHLWSNLHSFEYPFDEQVQVLLVTRRRWFTRPSQIPYSLKHTLATVCKKSYRRFGIEDLFINNRCAPSWWIHPLKPVDSERMELVFGWLDSILLYAPAQELSIVSAVCEDILRKPRPQNRRELRSGSYSRDSPILRRAAHRFPITRRIRTQHSCSRLIVNG
jgi:hypothetical protein